MFYQLFKWTWSADSNASASPVNFITLIFFKVEPSWNFLVLFFGLGLIWLCSGLTLGSECRDHSWQAWGILQGTGGQSGSTTCKARPRRCPVTPFSSSDCLSSVTLKFKIVLSGGKMCTEMLVSGKSWNWDVLVFWVTQSSLHVRWRI